MKSLFLGLFLTFSFIGCSSATQVLTPIHVQPTTKTISYLNDVKPILDKRCVSCHSCYNSPCQTKFSSFEGVDRGGSKLLVYDALRLSEAEPTRLFIDAQNSSQWHEKGFFSITKSLDTNKSTDNSLMLHMLHDKKMNPEVIGSYKPEKDDLICPKNAKELAKYKKKKPNHGMPYGFPKIKDSEYITLSQWLKQGAKGPTPKEQVAIQAPSKTALKEIQKWETFLNKEDAKHVMTARYLYEHYFLAHWYFSKGEKEFYTIVRSSTPPSKPIQIIPSIRPFDDPKVEKFYYRFEKIHSTIVHKTHMVVRFNDARMARFKELFIQPKWDETPYVVSYETKLSANPFRSFAQIPADSRYKFLLDNSHYIFMTFIRGPVCRGQMALNVINDHTWIVFKDPKYDVAVQDKDFLISQYDNLSLPIETSSQSILQTFSDSYRDKYLNYLEAKENITVKKYPYGQDIDSIWKGNIASDAAVLTIYRHFDSASVHKGVLGSVPKTLWVADFTQMERIYYSLVAGYNVFGNVSHQTNIRRYADFLRFEGEFNFISYMPQKGRYELLKSWYINTDLPKPKSKLYTHKSAIKYTTKHPKDEFMRKLIHGHFNPSLNINFDELNYIKAGELPPILPRKFTSKKDILDGFKSLTKEGTGFVKHVTEGDVNTMLVRIIMPDKKDIVGTIVVNRWHDNVNSLFSEGNRLNPSKDTLDFIPFSVGSYPNSFAVVKYEDLPDFFYIIENFKATDEDIQKFSKYFIGRSDTKFWSTFDWFQNHFNKVSPIESGLYDLNRYYHK